MKDACGIGEAPDAAKWGDQGTDTLGHVVAAEHPELPNLTALGLGNINGWEGYTDDEPIGCGALCLYDEMPSPDNPSGRCAYLMNMYTVPAARRRGVAGALVDWLVAYAREAGAGKIYLETTDEARGVYAARGFVDMEDYLKL